MSGFFRNNNQGGLVTSDGDSYFGPDTATVIEAIHGPFQSGRIRCHGGILWSAVCAQPVTLVPGQRVKLLSRQGNTWLVRPLMIPWEPQPLNKGASSRRAQQRQRSTQSSKECG